MAEATAYAAESLGAVRAMQAYNAQGQTAGRFKAAVEDAFAASRSAIAARAVLTGVMILFVFASVVGILWYGAHDVLAGRMSGGQLSQFLLYAVLGATSLGQLSEVWSELAAAAGSAGRIGDLLKVRPVIVAPASAGACCRPSPTAPSPSTASPSAIPPAARSGRCTTSPSPCAPARPWRSSAPRAPARPRCSSC